MLHSPTARRSPEARPASNTTASYVASFNDCMKDFTELNFKEFVFIMEATTSRKRLIKRRTEKSIVQNKDIWRFVTCHRNTA